MEKDIGRQPTLELLCSGYLHQDWAMDHRDESAALTAFVEKEGRNKVAVALMDIESILAVDDEAKIKARLLQLGLDYDPTKEFGTYRTWLVAVRDRLRSGVLG